MIQGSIRVTFDQKSFTTFKWYIQCGEQLTLVMSNTLCFTENIPVSWYIQICVIWFVLAQGFIRASWKWNNCDVIKWLA